MNQNEEKIEIKLMNNPFSKEEINAIESCIQSGNYTQGEIVKEFERKFAEWNGSKHAVMVNSGSSANLLIITLLKEYHRLKDDDEVLVPAVTWPTTVYPIIQNNLVPVFCDVDESFNISLESIKRMTSNKTRAIFLVHLLGQPVNLSGLIEFCKERGIIILEDCCEALGAIHSNKKVGTFGEMGSFSFYFGHHMATIEGGMITTDNLEIYDLLKSIRSHGWIRDSLRKKNYERDYEHLEFLFDYMGYNVRSTNLNAAIGIEQLKKVDDSIFIRKENHKLFHNLMSGDRRFILQKVNFEENSSFCLPLILESKEKRNKLLKELKDYGIESRPVVGGNLLRQPVFSHRLKEKYRNDQCDFSDRIHYCGMYLPNHQFVTKDNVKYMVQSLGKILDNYNGAID